MPQFSKIKDEKLRKLLKSSKKFKALSEEEKKKFFDQLKRLKRKEDIEKLSQFFVEENSKEEVEKEENEKEEKARLKGQIEKMKTLSTKIKEATQTIKKLKIKEDEKIQCKKDGAKEKELLEQLNNL